MQRNLWVLAVVISLAGIAIYQGFWDKDKPTMQAGEAMQLTNLSAPAFALQSLEGAEYKVGGERDKPLVLNFWASWCAPCEAEAPYLQQYYEQYGDDIDLYAVNVTAQDKLSQAKQFAELYGFSFPVLLDMEGNVAEKYLIRGIPTTFLINRSGIIEEVIHYVEPDDLEKKIRRLIRSG